MSIPRSHLTIFCISVGVAFVVGFLFPHSWNNSSKSIAIREYDDRYELLRPLLICQIDEQIETTEYRPLEKNVENVVEDSKRSGELTDASVYFRDLNTGRWTGINEEKTYSPASLLKVPLMISFFKQAESNPDLLNVRYPYVHRSDDINPLITHPVLESGKNYSVNELIRGMIIQSDNSAKEILRVHAESDVLNKTYAALGIQGAYTGMTAEDDYQISAKQYALFFRVLYNGTFLSKEMSNKALQLMSEVQFDMGLRAGTPSAVKVAHKYGIRATKLPDNSTQVELSDCGIIYSKQSPYLLCVMTSGHDPYVLANVIKRVAEEVYHNVGI